MAASSNAPLTQTLESYKYLLFYYQSFDYLGFC